MDFIIKLLEDFQEFITSEKVLAFISGSSTLFFIVSGIVSKIQKRKINIDNKTIEKTVKIVQDNYNKYVVNAEKTSEELKGKYLEATSIIQNIVETMKNQNEALEIAFNNSNLNASAKLLVAEKLKKGIETKNNKTTSSLTAIENEKGGQIITSNAVASPTESEESKKEVKDEQTRTKEIVRVK